MQEFFANYHTLFCRYCLKCIIANNERIAVQHMISFICSLSFKDWLELVLEFSKHNLEKFSMDSWNKPFPCWRLFNLLNLARQLNKAYKQVSTA